jgi:hypothetical protein
VVRTRAQGKVRYFDGAEYAGRDFQVGYVDVAGWALGADRGKADEPRPRWSEWLGGKRRDRRRDFSAHDSVREHDVIPRVRRAETDLLLYRIQMCAHG